MRDFISHNKINLLGLLETHVQQDLAAGISRFLAPYFSWVFNYNHHPNGRIWLGWDSSIWDVSVLSNSVQQFSCLVKNIASGVTFALYVVYGLNTYQERRMLWGELTGFKNSIGDDISWSLSGDFNVCLGPCETNEGTIWTRTMLEFRDFIISSGLIDLNCSGPKLTWWDSCKTDPCYKKLDMCLINGAWLVNLSMSIAMVQPKGLSDHPP